MSAYEEYLEKGWSPIPLPAGEKFPPPLNTTGNLPPIKEAETHKLWKGYGKGSNLGLRLQPHGDYDVISLDVDQYDSKQGGTHISLLEDSLGSLGRDENPRSTRRDPNNPSGQTFFRVPKGVKWKQSACSDVEVVQMTHRYAAVYPSVVDGKQYKWYRGTEEIDVPHVDDLPLLPEAWISYLHKSKVGRLKKDQKTNISPKSKDGFRDAWNWLRNNLSGWDVDGAMSETLKKTSDSDELRDRLRGNGHDTMVSAIHAVVMLGVEGHQGVKAALLKVKNNFIREISLREEGARSQDFLMREFKEALIGEVDRLIGEVESGSVSLREFGADLALPNFGGMIVREGAAKRPKTVEVGRYTNTDLGHAEMFRDYWGSDVLTISGGSGGEEFAVFDDKTTRYSFRSKKSMFGFLPAAVPDRLDYEAAMKDLMASELEARAESEQLEADEIDPDDLREEAEGLRARANRCRDTPKMAAILDQTHGFHENVITYDDFDSDPNLIGLPGGEVLNLLDLKKGEDYVRRGRQSDLITRSTQVPLVPNAKSDAWQEFLQDFLPDKEIRRFVQKALGYSLIAGNPDKKIVFLFGPSNTGKTTILESLANAMGDYAGPMNAIKLFGINNGGPAPEMVESLSKRMVFMAEVGDDHALSANSVKRVTGNDTQQQRQLHSNVMRNAAPKFTPYVSTNSVPDIKGVDQATKERILVIPFDNAHPRKKITPETDLKSKRNATAIFWWAVEGCKMYLDEGMEPEDWPEEVIKASNMFAKDTSPLQSFLDESIESTDDPEDKIGLNELYQLWENWCLKNRTDKKEHGSVSDFRKRIAGNGWKSHRGSLNGKRNQYFIRNAKTVSQA